MYKTKTTVETTQQRPLMSVKANRMLEAACRQDRHTEMVRKHGCPRVGLLEQSFSH